MVPLGIRKKTPTICKKRYNLFLITEILELVKLLSLAMCNIEINDKVVHYSRHRCLQKSAFCLFRFDCSFHIFITLFEAF